MRGDIARVAGGGRRRKKPGQRANQRRGTAHSVRCEVGGRFGKNLEVEGECAWSCSAFSMLPRLLAATAGPLSRHQAAVHGHLVLGIQSRKISSGRHPLTTARPLCTGKYLRYPATLAMQVLLSARPLAQWGVDDMELMESLLGWGSMDPSSTRTCLHRKAREGLHRLQLCASPTRPAAGARGGVSPCDDDATRRQHGSKQVSSCATARACVRAGAVSTAKY